MARTRLPRSANRTLTRAASAGAGPSFAALVSIALSVLVPGFSPLMWGLLVGILVANIAGSGILVKRWAGVSKVLLRLGIVLLGLQLSLRTVGELGLAGVAVIAVTVTTTFTGTRWFGRRLGMERDLVTLIATGFSICGAAAVAAVQDSIGAKQRDVGFAVALVTIFGTITLFLVPWAARLFALSDDQAAVWAGASIHEVAQVVAASSLIGSVAYPIASAVKLGRVMLLAPVAAYVSRGHASGKLVVIPWFVTGFVGACLIGSSGVISGDAAVGAVWLTNGLLAAGMFGLGLGLTLRDLMNIPIAAFLLATVATTIVVAVPFTIVMFLL